MTKAAEINVENLRRKAGLTMGQYVMVRDDRYIPHTVTVVFQESERDGPGEEWVESFDTEKDGWLAAVIDWLHGLAVDD